MSLRADDGHEANVARGTTVRQRVGLVKTSAAIGSEPLGARFEYLTVMDRPRDEAIARAFRLLKRDHPDENAMCWTVEVASEEADGGS